MNAPPRRFRPGRLAPRRVIPPQQPLRRPPLLYACVVESSRVLRRFAHRFRHEQRPDSLRRPFPLSPNPKIQSDFACNRPKPPQISFKSRSNLVQISDLVLLLRSLRAAVPQHPDAADFARPLGRGAGALGRGFRTGNQLAQALFALRLRDSSSGSFLDQVPATAARHSFRSQAGVQTGSALEVLCVCLPGARFPRR